MRQRGQVYGCNTAYPALTNSDVLRFRDSRLPKKLQLIIIYLYKNERALENHGPRCLADMGASAQDGHFEGAFGLSILRALGSQYFYNSGGQEFSSSWWLFGRMLGKQYNVTVPDEHHTQMLVGWGWNGMESHQMPRAPKVLKEFSKDPERLLVIVDPRKSETAAIANIHLPVRPGTDALSIKAMISIIVDNHWENKQYIADHVEGWDTIRPWFEAFDVKAALAVCELDHDQVFELCRLMTTRRWCMHPDLGIYMGRTWVWPDLRRHGLRFKRK